MNSSPGNGALIALGLVVLAACSPVSSTSRPGGTTPAADSDVSADALLDALQGAWDMEGQVMGEPVRYRAKGERVLQGGFLRLHMIDVSTPPQYEASVFIGHDKKAGDYIAHWLDTFGAAGARVVGTGSREGNRIFILYQYPDGTFRNTFTWRPDMRDWTLLIEAQQPDGSWTTFASYTMARLIAAR